MEAIFSSSISTLRRAMASTSWQMVDSVGTDITLDKVEYKFVKQDDVLALVTD